MTFITFQDGKPVMRDGKVGTAQACCCGECTGSCPCEPGCHCNEVGPYYLKSEGAEACRYVGYCEVAPPGASFPLECYEDVILGPFDTPAEAAEHIESLTDNYDACPIGNAGGLFIWGTANGGNADGLCPENPTGAMCDAETGNCAGAGGEVTTPLTWQEGPYQFKLIASGTNCSKGGGVCCLPCDGAEGQPECVEMNFGPDSEAFCGHFGGTFVAHADNEDGCVACNDFP